MITVRSLSLSFTLGLIEFIAGLLILSWKSQYFYLYVVMILGGTFDVPAFITGEPNSVIYNFMILPGVVGYHLYGLIIILYIFNRCKIFKEQVLKKAPLNMKRLVQTTDIMIVSGILFGAITLITNDNGILNIFWIRYLIGDIVSMCIIPMLGVCIIYNLLKFGEKYSILLQRILIAIMISVPIVTLFSIILGQEGLYGSEKILLAPLSLFFTPLIIMFVFYKKYNMRGVAVTIFSMCIFFQLFFSNALSGKSWLAVIFVIVMGLVLLYKKGYRKLTYFVITISLIFSGLAVSLIEKKIEDSTGVSTAKLAQAYLLLSVSNDEWYENIPFSPKVRLEEFLNIGQEYLKKPWFALFGKGWCGSVPDHRNGLGYNDDTSYSIDQYSNNSFINMHETINVVFLKYGIIGLLFLIIFVKKLFKTLDYSPWGACAILWLILFFSYSFCLGSFGFTSLIIAFFESDHNHKLCRI